MSQTSTGKTYMPIKTTTTKTPILLNEGCHGMHATKGRAYKLRDALFSSPKRHERSTAAASSLVVDSLLCVPDAVEAASGDSSRPSSAMAKVVGFSSFH
jgi:hypothetical protein